MNVTLACYQAVSILHGGPRVQILQTKAELEKLGVGVSLFQPWEPFDPKNTDVFHLFSSNLGTFHLARVINDLHLPIVSSSIFYTRRSPALIRMTLAANDALKSLRTGIWTDYYFTRQISAWSRAVLPNTHDEGRLLEEGIGVPKQKITVVPNGVEPRFEFGDPSLFKKKYGLEKFILNVGHIGPERKNVLNLIRALKTIDYPAVIIGRITPGRYGEQCIAEAKTNKNILIIDGLQNGSEMLASAYAAADVFALPSTFETPGIAALEAALAGAKIVITPIGGTKDYFGSLADYVDPYSPESIRDGIIRALNAHNDGSLKQHIKKEFLWSRVAEKTLAVYKTIASS
ncbi:MAG TPA: glycosyltransferase [Bacteroidota bacterium]|nr:glycosyltransferase [Bacteroidota bacterium]